MRHINHKQANTKRRTGLNSEMFCLRIPLPKQTIIYKVPM